MIDFKANGLVVVYFFNLKFDSQNFRELYSSIFIPRKGFCMIFEQWEKV